MRDILIDKIEYNICGNGYDADVQAENILNAVDDYVEDYYNKPMKWEKMNGLFTPGGDPAYICPNCHDRESEHVNGVECRTVWNYCPVCGLRLFY